MDTRMWRDNRLRRGGLVALALLALLVIAAWIEPLLIERSLPGSVQIGGEDLGVAQGWSAKEWSATLPSASGPVRSVYRWSGATSNIVFSPVARQQALQVTLRLLGGRPDGNTVAPVHVSANGHPLAVLAVGGMLRRYRLLVPGAFADQEALALQIDAPTFSPAGSDDRRLGVIGLDAHVAAAGPLPWLPHATMPLFLLALVALLAVNGLALDRTVLVAALALGFTGGLAAAAPGVALSALRTLAQLMLSAALVVGAARWWQHRGPPLRHPWRWAAALALLGIVLSLTPTMSADGVEYYAYLRSLAVDHDFDFTNEYKGPDVPFDRVPDWLVNNRNKKTGYVANLASVGPAIVWAPFYAGGDKLATTGRALGLDWTTDGYSLPYIAMINLAGAASLLITGWLCYLIARRLVAQSIALLASAALILGSAIIDYGLFEAHYPHALAAMAIAAYCYWWLRTRPQRSTGQWIVLGLLAGAMALMYWINALLMLLPALDLLPLAWRALRTRNWQAIGGMVGNGGIFLLATLLAFSPQMIAWQILYGSPFTIPHGAGFAEPHGFHALEMLVSPEHGQVLWAPVTGVAMLGMGWYIARRRWEGALIALVFTLYFLYNATLSSWHGGGPYGLRRIVNVLPLLTPGLACLLAWLGQRWRTAPLTLCVLCVAWNAALLLRYLTYLIPHHPGELSQLTVREFLLAPDNMPWGKLGAVLSGALFPRLLIQGAGKPPLEAWLPFCLLLGATIAILVGVLVLIRVLHLRATGRLRPAPTPSMPASTGSVG